MWNDEDNNPYGGSFDRQDSGFEPPDSPSDSADEPPEFISQPQDLDSDDAEEVYDEGPQQQVATRKKGGYDSRIEQILYEHPELEIVITDAGKSIEGGGSYIVYTIRTGDLEVRRRYSEFSSLRATLVSLHPTLIIPPIPEKHSMADYAAKPTKAKEDMGIIDLRKRMLGVFLNRCRRMKDVREDGVWWRFLDPNVSWNEVLHAAPVATIPKSNMKAPPLDPAHPSQAHQWLPVPSTTAKLRAGSVSSTGTPTSPPPSAMSASSAAHTIPGPQVFGRFPPDSRDLSEADLDPYFTNFEGSTRELEILLQGSIERVNRRTLSHLSSLATDMAELGARYNGFSLSEQSPSVAAAVERIGQAVDSSYLATEDLASTLGASFAEPMRESAQFAGVVRSVLRYRILKRIQEEMTKDELAKKRALLETLERSEGEAKRIDQYLNTAAPGASHSTGDISGGVSRGTGATGAAGATGGLSVGPDGRDAPRSKSMDVTRPDDASADSDFPPTHADFPSSPVRHEAQGDTPRRSKSTGPSGGGSVTNKILGRISHAVHGIVDVDPERTRRDQIGKTRESLVHLEQALEVSETDVKDASAGVLKDLKRFQGQKEEDLRRYMIAYAKCHIDWAKKNVDTWREAEEEVSKIDAR